MLKYIRKNIKSLLKPYKHVNIYVPQLNLIYLSITKTGNSSIKSMLLDKVDVKYDKDEYLTIHRKSNDTFQRITTKEITENKDAFKFSVVRNPFDRLVSCYKNKILEEEYLPIQEGFGKIFYKGMPFEEFVIKVCKIPDIFSDRHFRSQYSYLYYKDKLIVDYLGKFENLEEDLSYIIDKYKLEAVPHINKSSIKSDYRDYYTPELVRMVYKRYEDDIIKFNYQKEFQELQKYTNANSKL